MLQEAGRATPLIGRDDELQRVLALLDERRGGLVTITGRGGVGKTRLALEVVHRLEERRAGSAVFVPLATVTDPALVVHQIASTLGVPELPRVPILDAITGELAGGDRVLVLDSFEHVAGAATDVQELLAACPDLRVLVTAQAPLRLRAERVLRLSGLRDDAAVALYCDRAAAVDADFRYSDENAADIEALCRALEGLPLAIELAAARAVTIPAAEVRARLERHGLELLKADYRDVPERHRGLRAAINWTYELLDDGAKALLRRLTVTGGSFDLDDAEALAPNQAFDALGALVDLHLVDRRTGTSSTSYFIPDSIRDFAAQLLTADEREAAMRTWLTSVAGRARQAAIAVDADGERAAREWLASHHDELTIALSACLDRDQIALALDVLSALAAHWLVVSMPSAYRELLQRALDAVASGECDPATLTETLADASVVLRWESRTAMGEWLERAEALAERCDDERAHFHVLAARTLSSAVTGDFEGSRLAALEGLARAENAHAARWLGRFNVWLGMIDHASGDHDAAVERGLRGLAYARETDDEQMILEASMLLLPLKELLSSGGAELPPSDELIDIARRRGRFPWLVGLLPNLAVAALVEGDVEKATALCHESLQLARGYLATPLVVFSLMCCARLAHAAGHHDRVAYLHGVVADDIPRVRAAMPPQSVVAHDRAVEEAVAALGPEVFEAEVARGRAEGRRPAVEHALEWTAPSRPADRKDLPGRSNMGPLSPRQTDVLVLMASGLTNKEIAERLGITRRTAEHHTEAIFRKLGVRGRTEATAWAHRNGLVSP